MADQIIHNASIADGTGATARLGGLAITDGRITALWDGPQTPEDQTAEVIHDANGKVLCPGFIDPHTHYDAQLLWDPTASPSNLHGVTTIIGGNCGFTLAPLGPDDADYTRKMLAKVEGMPLAALEAGVDGDWDGFGEYLDRLDGSIAVNAGFLVGHCALRRRVMGASAVGSDPTPDQMDQMRSLLRTSIEAGGLGFSTTLARTHSDGDGQPVASRWAKKEELLSLAQVISELEGTTLEFASNGCLDGFDEEEVQFMIDFTAAAQRPLNWNVLTVDSNNPDRYRNQLEAMDTCRAAGAHIKALTMPILVGMNMSFLNFCALNLMPDWGPILALPLVARKACLRDPEVREFMKERAASPDAGVFSRLAGWERYVIGDTYSAANEGLTGKLIADLAKERGTEPFDTLLDIVLADDCATILWPGPTDDDDESWRLRAEAWEHPSVLIGGSDAGAHLDRMAGAPYTTQWIGDCIRGRKLTSMERAIQHLTDAPAQLFGLKDRGRIAVGYHADLVLFDPETIDAGSIELVSDLPGDTGRLMAEAIGVHRVIVGGVDIVVDGVPTDALPGRIIRSGADTETVSLG
ncbi:MAG TPA: aminoacylase [Acidimicrobiaceae bacterium]|nr:aminoacylase [Acidimicrobiaceae bacterium]